MTTTLQKFTVIYRIWDKGDIYSNGFWEDKEAIVYAGDEGEAQETFRERFPNKEEILIFGISLTDSHNAPIWMTMTSDADALAAMLQANLMELDRLQSQIKQLNIENKRLLFAIYNPEKNYIAYHCGLLAEMEHEEGRARVLDSNIK